MPRTDRLQLLQELVESLARDSRCDSSIDDPGHLVACRQFAAAIQTELNRLLYEEARRSLRSELAEDLD